MAFIYLYGISYFWREQNFSHLSRECLFSKCLLGFKCNSPFNVKSLIMPDFHLV